MTDIVGVDLSLGVNISGVQTELLGYNSDPTTTTPGPVNANYRRHVIKIIYTVAELNAAGISGSTTLRALGFFVTNAPNASYQPYPSYTVGMQNTASAVGSDLTTGWTTVRNAANFNFAVDTAGLITVLDFNTNFTWNGTSNLAIGFAWGMIPTGFTAAGVVRSNTSGSFRYALTDSAGTYVLTDVAGSTQSGRPAITLYRV